MPKSVKVENEALPQDAEVEVPGLGVFPNGATIEVSDEKLAEYEAAGYHVPEGDFEYKVVNREVDKSAPSEEVNQYEEAAAKSDAALSQQLEFQEQRATDPNATANVGAPVVLEQNTNAEGVN